jgi:aspartyl-tRNA(Asn)/glutamyl-tRNA(Gln) amidotransferase subunit A
LKPYNRISDIRADLQSGAVTCLELVQEYISAARNNQHLNAFLEIWEDEALSRATEIDVKIKNGTAGKLAGIVIALKDVLAYKDHKVSASSKILEGFQSLYSATAVQRLWDEDAIFIGRTNCDEFAMGASNENSAYGPVLNAADNSRVPGGSSGGSAVAVQANMCHAALGTDTGGSIRQPAAFTGVYGFKPTYGAVSRWGLLAYASSFDQIGTFCKSLEDTDLLLSIMSGPDGQDSTAAANHQIQDFQKSTGQKFRFAVMEEAMHHPGLHPDVKQIMADAISRLEAEGHTITYFQFPLLEYMVPTYYVLTTAEASSNLSRYSGLLYGKRSEKAKDLESTFVASRTEGFGTEVKRRIMLGTFVLSSDYYDAYYRKGQQVRNLIRTKTREILDNCDAILIPTTSTPAFKIGEKAKDPIAMYLADLFTVQANLAGVPAISIPYGQSGEQLPIGLQLLGKEFEERKLFALSETIMSTKANS